MTLKLTRDQVVDYYPGNQFVFLWCYDNCLVLREEKASSNGTPTYIFFSKADEWYYDFILATKDFEFGKEISDRFWYPKKYEQLQKRAVSKEDFARLAVEQIDYVLSSKINKLVKKNKEILIDHFDYNDFAFVYFAQDTWHAYCPSLKILQEFHLTKQAEKQNIHYLSFITNQEVFNKKDEWDREGVVRLPVKTETEQ
jgi:hypothetical protein